MESASIIDARGLSIASWTDGVSGVSFSVKAGETYCLLGGPGSGKTAILDLVLGLRRPTAGQVRVDSLEPSASPVEVRKRIGFIGGANDLYDRLTPAQNIRLFTDLSMGGSPPADADILHALRHMGVAERYFDQPVFRAPREVRLATAIAIAFLRKSPVVLLDDPSQGLDSRASAALIESFDVLRHQRAAVLVTTSDVLFAGQVADRIGLLKQGEKVAERARYEWLGQNLMQLYADYVGRPVSTILGNHVSPVERPGRSA